MAIDLVNLQRAIARLEAGLVRYRAESDDDQIRDGLIQRFEFTYDLAPKVLRRVLEAASDSPPTIDLMSFPTLMRTAWEKGLIKGGWPVWNGFRDMRNTTSHLYDEQKAIEVADKIPAFLEEVRFLAEQLAAFGSR